jgi:hypothetical protein
MQRKDGRSELVRLALRAGAALALLSISVLLLRATWRMYVRMTNASQAQQQAQVELAAVAAQQHGASSTLEALSTAQGQEAQIRQRFDLAKPGEGEIDLIYTASSAGATATSSAPWWQKVWQALWVW